MAAAVLTALFVGSSRKISRYVAPGRILMRRPVADTLPAWIANRTGQNCMAGRRVLALVVRKERAPDEVKAYAASLA